MVIVFVPVQKENATCAVLFHASTIQVPPRAHPHQQDLADTGNVGDLKLIMKQLQNELFNYAYTSQIARGIKELLGQGDGLCINFCS